MIQIKHIIYITDNLKKKGNKIMKTLCNLQIDVQMQDNGLLDVYINNEGDSGCHYTDVDSAKVGRLVEEEIDVRGENHKEYNAETKSADVKTMNLMVVEHEGLGSRSFVLKFEVVDAGITCIELLKDAVRKACAEYIQTEKGKETYHFNCEQFNWADFADDVPNEICEKYGFRILDHTGFCNEVDWDEQLIDESVCEPYDEDGDLSHARTKQAEEERAALEMKIKMIMEKNGELYKETGISIADFNCDDLKKYISSMLFDAGTCIASVTFRRGEECLDIILQVFGEISITYKGKTYNEPDEYPDELVDMIKKDPEGWGNNPDVEVSLNNWFEYIYDGSDDEYEGDLHKATPEMILDDMIYIAKRAFGCPRQ